MEVGEKVNRLTLIKKCEGKKSLFRCDCGNEKMINIWNVEYEKVKSCGCLFRECPNHTKHGGKGTRLYKIWKSMRERCSTPSQNRYKNYGGRGIKVCEEWDDFNVFREWALSHGYSDELTVDRIDVNGNYEPLNCRWITPKEQANNKTNNRYITFNGITKTMTQWAEEKGMKASTLWARLDNGWSIERALNTPIIKY